MVSRQKIKSNDNPIKANLSRVHSGGFHEEDGGRFGKFVQQLHPPLQYLCFCEGLNEMYCCSCTCNSRSRFQGRQALKKESSSPLHSASGLLTVDIDYKRSSSSLDVVHVSSHLIM